MNSASELNKTIIASGLSRQAWFEQPVDMPLIQEGDLVRFSHKYGYTGMGQIWAIDHDKQEVVIVNDSVALTLTTQSEWDTCVLIEKAEDMPMFEHISFASRIVNAIKSLVA